MEGWAIDEKVRLVSSRLRAEPLEFCLLSPEVEYFIVEIERLCCGVVVYVLITNDKLLPYLLPTPYGEMVAEADIYKINCGQQRYTIIRKVKKCGPHKIRFDHKSYTWDLQLQRL